MKTLNNKIFDFTLNMETGNGLKRNSGMINKLANMKSKLVEVTAIALLIGATNALAQTTEYGEYDYTTMIENYSADEITAEFLPLNSGMMGESHDINTGTLTFRHVDVSIPGNSHLPVQFARTYSDTDLEKHGYDRPPLGTWEVDTPFVVMRTLQNQSLNVDFCATGTNILAPNSIQSNASIGIKMNIPGQGTKFFSGASSSTYPGAGSNIKYTTKDFYKVTCGLNLVGASGKGFTVTAPNGDEYLFNKVLRRYSGQYKNSHNEFENYDNLYFMVTQITDVDGNWVKYEYNTHGVTKIHSSDLRQIDIAYTNDLIDSVTANGRQWDYEYISRPVIHGAGFSTALSKVTLPDNTFWDIGIGRKQTSTFCHYRYTNTTPVTFISTMKHPNGTVGTFKHQIINHQIKTPIVITSQFGSSASVPANNQVTLDTPCSFGFPFSWQFFTFSLTQKTITKPNGVNLTWTYDYHEPASGWESSTNSQGESGTVYSFTFQGALDDNAKRTVIDPEGHKTITYINRVQAGTDEGNVSKIEVYETAASTTPLSTTFFDAYTNVQVGNPSPVNVRFTTLPQRRTPKPSDIRIVQNGDTFTTVTEFDTNINSADFSYGFPTKSILSSSTHSSVRTFDMKYEHNTTHWKLGLTKEIKLNGTIIDEYVYDTLGRVYTKDVFGRLRATFEYHTNSQYKGAVKSITNADNEKVELLNWYRGSPQQIKRPDGVSTYQYRNANGWVSQVVDGNGNCTDYGYNDVGWLELIDPCNTAWANTTMAYAVTTSNEGLTGVSAGMLKQTITSGNYEKIAYLDHFYQPVMTRVRDVTIPSSAVYSRAQFNSDGAAVYQSKPHASHTTPYGTFNSFDALGRIKVANDNTFSGSVSFNYLSNNRVSMNDNKGHTTTTTYKDYGSPSQSLVTLIQSPESVNTSMTHDIFGKVISISQGGITEHRIYDAYQQLCKTVRPDVGNVAFGYNSIGQQTWSAAGSSVSGSTSTCDNSVSSTEKITYTYYNTGLLNTINYGDSSPDKTYVFDNNNNVLSITAGSVQNIYTYDTNNNLESEALHLDGKSFQVSHAYNALSHRASSTYPDFEVVNYQPNALGQERSAGVYATAATYHANGMLKTFTYGNGFTHTSDQHTSGLPKNYYDVKSGVKALDYYAAYDENGNMTTLRDDQNSLYDLSLAYDGLDRLDTINDSFMGSGAYNYDTMGNITSYTLGSRNINYHYNTTSKRLMSTSGSKSYAFSYDERGNVTDNGDRAFDYNLAQHVTYSPNVSFNYDGQDKRVKKVINGQSSYFMYGANGKLLFQEKPNGGIINHIYLAGRAVAKAGDTSEVGRMHYTPFGEPEDTSKVNDEMSYTSHVYDDDLDLVYMQARYYDPVIGRFYSNDPISSIGHLNGLQGIHGFNRFTYVNNNPYKYTDPNGECAEPLSFVGCVGVFLLGYGTGKIVDAAIGNEYDTELVDQNIKGAKDLCRKGIFKACLLAEKFRKQREQIIFGHAHKIANEAVCATLTGCGGPMPTNTIDLAAVPFNYIFIESSRGTVTVTDLPPEEPED